MLALVILSIIATGALLSMPVIRAYRALQAARATLLDIQWRETRRAMARNDAWIKG